MSAILAAEDLQPVADLLERVQCVQRALRDLHEAHEDGLEFSVAIATRPPYGKEAPVAHTHTLSYWVVLQGLAAMERELLKLLQDREITVESVLPMGERA